jgi:deferrochelatase/peroxidase EfeB
MSNALTTIIAPLAVDRVPEAQAAIDRLGNPPDPEIRAALDRLQGNAGTHFASLHAVRSSDGERAYIVFEFSADGPEDEALARILAAIGDRLRPVFMMARDWTDGGDLGAYLRAHRVAVGGGWSDNPGVVFAGTPNMPVGRIRGEAALAARISEILGRQQGPSGEDPSRYMDALERVEAVRNVIADDPEYVWALEPGTPDPPYQEPSFGSWIATLALSFVKTYLTPVVVLLVVAALVWGVLFAWPVPWFGPKLAAFFGAFLEALWVGFWIALVAVLGAAGITYFLLVRAEERDAVDERTVEAAVNAAMFARENHCAQNHMISVTQRKPGLIRWFTSRLVFWAIAEFATRYYRPGFLSDIGTIHFARWVTPPGSPDVIFLSNYGGSWESYLEDFITRAHAGLTGVWSNSIGFPRTENLIQKGATDGERFKRYARHSMVPTRFWYSAYPSLTTSEIRTNADIRRGLSGTMTEDEAMLWLAQFGSAARPVSKLVSNEIQSLLFGGLGFKKFGACLLFDLPDDVVRARRWLRAITPYVAFNDGRRLRRNGVITLALGAGGLKRLGLPEESLATFPFAFLEGMTTEARSRILGDVGKNAPSQWRWGATQPDVALLIYARSRSGVERRVTEVVEQARAAGMAEPYRIPLKPLSEDKTEPFGFVDGISQPVIRGTYKARRYPDEIHLVDPGEFILGYPDNRDNLPPGPTLPATADPENRLPLLCSTTDFSRSVVETTRDVGFNGSFLVIRQLEQDVDGFDAYCQEEAALLRQRKRLPAPYVVDQEFIAAKLVGRWKDGSPLVRHPYEPAPAERARYKPEKADKADQANRAGDKTDDTARAKAPDELDDKAGKAAADGQDSAAAKARQVSAETVREVSKPEDPGKTPIDQPPKGSVNDFLFGTEDPEALRCPYGAHIRRANPRDSFDPGSDEQISISNRHRIIRVGRLYEPAPGENEGLLFMCLNGDIERQFEFLQQSWLMSPSFHGLSCEKDPLLGDGEKGVCNFTIPSREGPVRLNPMPSFVTTRGGGYFFLPGKRLLEYLGAESP